MFGSGRVRELFGSGGVQASRRCKRYVMVWFMQQVTFVRRLGESHWRNVMLHNILTDHMFMSQLWLGHRRRIWFEEL